MNLGIKGKKALVTASSTGIGKAIAESLVAEGCQVAICSRSKTDLEKTALEIKRKTGTEPFWTVCDITKPEEVETAYNTVTNKIGSINILVNNCGGPSPGNFLKLKENEWQDAFDLVLLSAVRFSNLVVPDMIVQEWGRIINVTSISVKQPIDDLILSNSLRSGVVGFAKSLSNELARYNITVNNVAPGYTLTNRLYELAVSRAKEDKKSHEEILAEMSKKVPMNRLARPEEIAALTAFLASNNASYITGNTIHVDGGIIKSIF